MRAANVSDGRLNLEDVKEMNFTPGEQLVFALRPGDVLVTEGSGSLGAVGASAVWRGEIPGTVCFQNTLLRLRPRDGQTDPRFLAWWSRATFADGVYASIASGANIFHLSADRVRALPLHSPPLDEQRRIADFLDAETSRVDALRAKRLVQVSVLNELELALINKHLTSAEILGPVYAYFDVQLGKMLNAERSAGYNQKPYLRNANVHWYEINTEDMATMTFEADEGLRYGVRPGDLLVCEGGAGVAEAAVWDGRISTCFYQKSLHRVRARGPVPVEWLMYWLRYAKAIGVFDAEGNIATIPHLTGEQLTEYKIPIPEDGQRRVTELSENIAAIRKTQRTMMATDALLAERRQALITAAVTGGITV
jgi:type I restriction enzyme S subunit